MKKDIQIPEVSGVDIAIVFEYDPLYKTDDWNVYIINQKEIDLEMVVIVLKGFNDNNITSVLRKKIDRLAANSYAKVEFIQPELFQLNNQYQVTFFWENTLFEKTFLFPKNTIKEGALRMLPLLNKRGILSK